MSFVITLRHVGFFLVVFKAVVHKPDNMLKLDEGVLQPEQVLINRLPTFANLVDDIPLSEKCAH